MSLTYGFDDDCHQSEFSIIKVLSKRSPQKPLQINIKKRGIKIQYKLSKRIISTSMQWIGFAGLFYAPIPR